MWTLANHPRVPEAIRKHFQTWGLARDEFTDTDNWPHQLYVREARRMKAAYVMIEQNCRGQRVAEDSVGLAAYTMDSHNVQRYVTSDGYVRNEGDVQVGGFPPYPIGYRSIVPKAEECTNLLVPVCLSASHISYGSIRMEPVFMVLGQSAATAAALALDGKSDVQSVDYPRLRERLLQDKQVLDWTGPKGGVGSIDSRKLEGIVVDDPVAEREGFDHVSSSASPYVNEGYRHDGNENRGKQWARYRPNLPGAGKYEVRLSYSANPNRATNVPVTIVHAAGKTIVKVNQKKPAPLDRAFVSLGTFRFEKGNAGYVEISNRDADGYVIIDAVQWLPVRDAPGKGQPEAMLEDAKRVLAKLEGELSLAGLREPVEVLRDRWGIAHVYAGNAHDLFFAQGFVAAQDRLFQLELWRRHAAGEMAELLGPQAVEGDRFARLMKYRGNMEAEWTSYSPDTKEIATAFVQGINVCIDKFGDRPPIEFQLLGIRPRKWQPQDVLGRMAGLVMSRNFRTEIERARLIGAVGIEKARWLAPIDPPANLAPAIPEEELKAIDGRILAGYEAATRTLSFRPPKTESNNWVVAGSRSVSGKPLLASDPHRAIALPSLRYLIHLHAPGWNVIGSGEPALPGVAIGHNDRIAWGFTIVGVDQADIFVEETNPQDPGQYKVGDRWEKMTIHRETIGVKGERDRQVELRWTRHGPVLFQDSKRQRAYALKWVGHEPGGAAYLVRAGRGPGTHPEGVPGGPGALGLAGAELRLCRRRGQRRLGRCRPNTGPPQTGWAAPGARQRRP